jgi:LysM repeat protein/ABC-type branched-subunit amino acid transport system substrate-binding protein
MDMKRAFLLLVTIAFTHALIAQTDFVIEEYQGKRYYIHTVEQGNTLFALSKLYKVSVEEIVSNNPGSEEGLALGTSLRIPVVVEPSDDKWDNPVRMDGGYLVHRVKRGETLFSICKSYKADINDVLEENPLANSGIRPGDELRIRMNDVDETSLIEVTPDPEDSLKRHTVTTGETLYAISKLYGLTVESILEANGGLPFGLKAGEQIIIPIKDVGFSSAIEPPKYTLPIWDNEPIKGRYNITMLLPLYLQYGDTLDAKGKQAILRNLGLQFYRGAMLAIDSLKKYGLNADVNVLDVNDTKGSVDRALSTNSVKDSHLIIGPFQRSTLTELAAYSSRKGIHMVCPVPQQNKVLLNSPNLSKVQASDITLMTALASKVAEEYHMHNVVLISGMDTRDARINTTFRNTYNSEIRKYPLASFSQLREVNSSSKTVGNVVGSLSLTMKNVLIMPSSDQVLIQDLLTKLNLLDREKYEIVLIGTEDWLSMEFINAEYKSNLHITVPSSGFSDYNRQSVKQFVAAYRKAYNEEPPEYAFIGYDVMLYYGLGLLDFGIGFPNHFDQINQKGLLYLGFDFEKTGLESGYENNFAYLLQHEGYELEIVESSNEKSN